MAMRLLQDRLGCKARLGDERLAHILEQATNDRVHRLYGLTPGDVKAVEGSAE